MSADTRTCVNQKAATRQIAFLFNGRGFPIETNNMRAFGHELKPVSVVAVAAEKLYQSELLPAREDAGN